MTRFTGFTYLKLPGVRPTVPGHDLEKYESSEKLSGQPPIVEIITLLIAYRQLRTRNQKTLNFQLSSPEKFENSEVWKCSRKFSTFLNFGKSSFFGYEIYYPKNIRKSLPLQKGVKKIYKQHLDTC